MAQSTDEPKQRSSPVIEPPTGFPPLWIGERDSKDQPVEPTVRESAQRIWRRVVYYVRKERSDDTNAAEVFEEAVHAVSRRMQRDNESEPIHNIDSYLFHSFVHRFLRRVRREDRIQYYDSSEALDSIGRRSPKNPMTELENRILLKQVISAMDSRIREMFALRSAGHSWKEVGRQFGISAHNAEVQFAYGLKKAKTRLGLDEQGPKARRRKT